MKSLQDTYGPTTICFGCGARSPPGGVHLPAAGPDQPNKVHVPDGDVNNVHLLYAARGPKGITMRAIAAALGVRASALYRHFESTWPRGDARERGDREQRGAPQRMGSCDRGA